MNGRSCSATQRPWQYFTKTVLLMAGSRRLKVNMESQQEPADVLRLLEEYCNLRSRPKIFYQSAGRPSHSLSRRTIHRSLPSSQQYFFKVVADSPRDSEPVIKAQGPGGTEKTVPERLAQIADLAPITDQNLQTQDEIIRRLVQLLITFGDDIEEKLKQNPALRQQLQNLNYGMFEKLTSTVQNLVAPSGRAAGSDPPAQKQRIAWAFEVTSRLSAVAVVHRRAVLNFGARYIEENHAGWLQQHGGWEEAFD
ncbi:apoptosis facilitator Bcl-2-like protein 14 [Fundulus heteroclitus]|uniref:apoptosis facilitator Bcl-2-like protein 14 n=1 Tax=Fundulus heteroclitus TaxID=8078 RepID=UPI00165B10A2|nr:apoptosis facilitator Bcl-2-like protein 14 [Fundulus heteroclitus]